MKGSIVFFENTDKANTITVRKNAMQVAEQKGFTCIEIQDTQSISNDHLHNALFLVAIGGDGTILKSVPYAAAHCIPILGINTGRVGFLSEIQPHEFSAALDTIDSRGIHYEQRMMLSCMINGQEATQCLNEFVLYRHATGGTVHISITIDGQDAGAVFCDGMIICTPTGATGYSISAGGPVIAPGLMACIITPICPHTLTAKPIVISPGACVEFLMNSDGIVLTDGQKTAEVNKGDRVRVKQAAQYARFIRFGDKNLFQLIKDKLT